MNTTSLCFIVGFCFVSFLFWLGGFTFFERGIATVFWFTISVFIGGMAAGIYNDFFKDKE